MARRKINIQKELGAQGVPTARQETQSTIDQLSSSMSEADIGFKPTDQRVYEVDLDRILPDPAQPRHLLPTDLRQALQDGHIEPSEVMQQLTLRAEENDMVALLILGGKDHSPIDEDDEAVEDTGLKALAQSIREVGLRQPLNVYRLDNPNQPDRVTYRLGEGERRFWAHHLLVKQGHKSFNAVRCIVEPLPEDEEVIHQRQEAENAARVDLPAIARARSMLRIKERLNIEMGTRVPGENTIRLPGQRQLQVAVGQRVKTFTGRAIGDRMVRNYLALLNMSSDAQDLAEAGLLTEKQLRPVMRIKDDEEQLAVIRRIVEEKWSGRRVMTELTSPPVQSTLREISQTTVEQRFEKRVLDAAKTMHALLTLPQENYDDAINNLSFKATDMKVRQALQSLRQSIEEILLKVEELTISKAAEVRLISIRPPLDALRHHLPAEKFQTFQPVILTGSQILDRLLAWRQDDVVLASRLEPFFAQVELDAEALRAGEFLPMPLLKGERNSSYPDLIVYDVEAGASIYWAHELLVKQGEVQFRSLKAEVIGIRLVDDN